MNKWNMMLGERTRAANRENRVAYLSAIAQHHARVAQAAVDMAAAVNVSASERSIDRVRLELLEEMADKIERSHFEAFGCYANGEMEREATCPQ